MSFPFTTSIPIVLLRLLHALPSLFQLPAEGFDLFADDLPQLILLELLLFTSAKVCGKRNFVVVVIVGFWFAVFSVNVHTVFFGALSGDKDEKSGDESLFEIGEAEAVGDGGDGGGEGVRKGDGGVFGELGSVGWRISWM